MIRITLPPPPSANVYWRTRLSYGSKKPRAVTYRSPEANAYAARVRTLGQLARLVPFTGEVVVVIDWYRDRRAGDVDNRIKPLLDALQGLAFVNDNQVRRVVATRYQAEQARVDVTVYPWGDRTAATEAATFFPEAAA